jgi:hypothetical protein
LNFGIVSDREQMPDVWSLIGWLGDALNELEPAAEVPAGAPGIPASVEEPGES